MEPDPNKPYTAEEFEVVAEIDHGHLGETILMKLRDRYDVCYFDRRNGQIIRGRRFWKGRTDEVLFDLFQIRGESPKTSKQRALRDFVNIANDDLGAFYSTSHRYSPIFHEATATDPESKPISELLPYLESLTD